MSVVSTVAEQMASFVKYKIHGGEILKVSSLFIDAATKSGRENKFDGWATIIELPVKFP